LDAVENKVQIGDDNMDAPNRTLKQKAYQGLKEYLFISFYLWVVFALFVLYKSIILAEQHISSAAGGFALINALALGKIMLLAQEFHFGERYSDAPLIYPTLFKSAAFAIILGCFKILEEAGVGWYHGRSFQESMTGIGDGTVKGILTLTAILAVLLIPFFGFTELRKVLGADELRRLLFTSRHPAGSSS
jgi:hypothetical protein